MFYIEYNLHRTVWIPYHDGSGEPLMFETVDAAREFHSQNDFLQGVDCRIMGEVMFLHKRG